MRYTVILVPDDGGQVSALVPALPGCVSVGGSRHEALEHAREAIAGWLATEAAAGRASLVGTTSLIEAGVREALQIIDDLRAAGEVRPDHGYDLELAIVEVRPPVAA
jgi:predicted RNase H-like HicB family nuclease